uniref:G-protein coupled receptors family 1 profile domain-containing protein n=1 Tax=Rhinopithecus bieti TaxID=61621 RepID=A0A2K6KCA2_RHIBE
MITTVFPNNSVLFPHTFFLDGIPGLTAAHIWISLPFCFMFFLSLTGNGPMFLFLAMLSFVDLVLSLSTLPKMLAIFWFGAIAISSYSCLSQMFFTHAFLCHGALDCSVAMRYATILTPVVIAKIGGLVVLRGMGLTISFPRLHMAVVKLACGATTVDNLYAFAVAILLGVGDVAFIARAKAGGTCIAHVCVILFFYGPGFLSVVMQHFGPSTASAAKVILANLCLLFPPALDPFVYGMKTKQIRERLLMILSPKWIEPT